MIHPGDTRGRVWVVVLGVVLWLSPADAGSVVGGGQVGLLKRVRALEREGAWREALEEYRRLRGVLGDEADRGIARCRRQLRIALRSRSIANRDFARKLSAARGLILYEEVLERIRSSYLEVPPLERLVVNGLENCLAAPHNPAFVRAYRPRLELLGRWEACLEELRARALKGGLQPSGAADLLARLLSVNARTVSLPDGAVVLEMIHGAVECLDPYSAFLNPDRLRVLEREIEGEFVGIGVRVAVRGRVPVVVEVMEGSPADRAGVGPGDRILAVAGRPTAGMGLEEVAHLLQGPPHTAVALEVAGPRRPRPVLLTLFRERILLPSVAEVRRMGRGGRIGYLRLVSFQKGTGGEVRRAVEGLAAEGVGALIIDLRGNPGGVLESAAEVADLFLRDGIVVSTRGRAWGQNWTFRARPDLVGAGWPMVLLVDRMSASATEVLTAALHDHRRATVIGGRTFGKGSVQSLFVLGRGMGGLRLTTARFYAPNGETFDGVGIAPDVEVEEGGSGDAALAEAVRFLEVRLTALAGGPRARAAR